MVLKILFLDSWDERKEGKETLNLFVTFWLITLKVPN